MLAWHGRLAAAEQEGAVFLVQCRWDRSDRLPRDQRHKWFVSNPTIKAESGKFLAGDPEGLAPFGSPRQRQGAAHRAWVFEIVSQLQPGQAKGQSKGDSHLKEGASGFTFRVKVAEAPFEGWYLAAEAPPEDQKAREGEGAKEKERKGQEPKVRRLKLVKEVRGATVFTYIDENYYVGHK